MRPDRSVTRLVLADPELRRTVLHLGHRNYGPVLPCFAAETSGSRHGTDRFAALEPFPLMAETVSKGQLEHRAAIPSRSDRRRFTRNARAVPNVSSRLVAGLPADANRSPTSSLSPSSVRASSS